jgi:hypothetical protein
MKATDRHKARVQEMIDSPMEGEESFEQANDIQMYDVDNFAGETSDLVRTLVPAAAGIAAELGANKLKSGEDAKKKKEYEASEAFQANKAAQEAEKRAALAQADAVTEADPLGPKHKAAAELGVQAQAARQKSNYFAQQAAMSAGQMPGGAIAPQGYYPPPSIFTPKNLMIGGGVLAGLVVLGLLLRRK